MDQGVAKGFKHLAASVLQDEFGDLVFGGFHRGGAAFQSVVQEAQELALAVTHEGERVVALDLVLHSVDR